MSGLDNSQNVTDEASLEGVDVPDDQHPAASTAPSEAVSSGDRDDPDELRDATPGPR